MIVEDEAEILQARRPGTKDSNEIFEYTMRAPDISFLNSTMMYGGRLTTIRRGAFRYGSLLTIPSLEGVVDNPFPKH